MSLPSNGWARPRGKANCFSSPTNPAAACSNFTAIEFVDCPMYGECEVCISPKRQMRAFGLVRGGGGRKKRSQPPAALSVSKGTKVLLGPTRRRVVAIWTDHAPEALQRRVSLVLVTRTQVQPVS